jgi:hypothetical protein
VLVTLRSVVPALAAVAVLSSSAVAADHDVVQISGWSDNLFAISDNDYVLDTASPTTPKNEGDTALGFATNASIKLAWTVTNRVHAKVNVWLYNQDNFAAIVTPYGGSTDSSSILLRESFLVVDLDESFSWTMGKYENNLGWISKEPTGLYRVNPSTIGYENALYGNDVVGTALTFRPKGSQFNGTLHVVNGYFNGVDTFNSNSPFASGHGSTAQRENWDLGYGLDLGWDFGKPQSDKTSNIDLELTYDPHGGNNVTAANQRAGSVFQAGLNATARAGEWGWNKDLTLGGEVIWRETTTAKTQAAGAVTQVAGTHREDFGWMLLGNYGIGKGSSADLMKSIPASITVSYQQYTTNWRAAAQGEMDANELAFALLSNPLDNANFGLNAELAFDWYQNRNPQLGNTLIGGTGHGTDNAWIFTVEAIALIP